MINYRWYNEKEHKYNLFINYILVSNWLWWISIILFTLSSTYDNNDTRYTLQVVYNPTEEDLTTNMSPGNVNKSGAITTITDEMKNATITVSGNGINNNNNCDQW